jgi:hypothetical protein
MRIWFNRHFSLVGRVVRLLREAQFTEPMYTLVSHRRPEFSGFIGADHSFLEPDGLSGDDYVQWCLATAQAQAVDWLIPGHAADVLAQAAPQFAQIGVRLLNAAQAPLLPLLNQKDWVYANAPPQVPKPRFAVIDDAAQLLPRLVEFERTGASCIKPCVGVYGQGFHRLQSAVLDGTHTGDTLDLEGWSQRYRPPSAERRQLLMEFLPGHEYSIDLACKEGELLAAVVRCKALDGTSQTLVDRPDLCAHARQLVEAFALNGLINVQFKDAADGSPKLLELNPRASGGIAMSCLSGLNLPAIAYRACMLDQRLPLPAQRFGLRVTEVPTAIVLPAAA